MESAKKPVLSADDHARLEAHEIQADDILKVFSVPVSEVGRPEKFQAACAGASATILADKLRRDGRCLGNQIFAGRWTMLIQRHRSSLCFCDECERLRQDGVSWLGHHFSCAVHGMTVRQCQWCMRQSLVTRCDCGPVPYRTPMSSMRKSHVLVPSSAEALLARFRIVFWSRLSRVRSFLQLSILDGCARLGLRQFEGRLKRPRHLVSERTCGVQGCEQIHLPPNTPNVSP